MRAMDTPEDRAPVADHQRLTIERYDALVPLVKPYVMPVLQGYTVGDYLRHLWPTAIASLPAHGWGWDRSASAMAIRSLSRAFWPRSSTRGLTFDYTDLA